MIKTKDNLVGLEFGRSKWLAQININCQNNFLGYFTETEIEDDFSKEK